jgi:hypothetical protein
MSSSHADISDPLARFSIYELEHLIAHLDEAGRFGDIHRILALEAVVEPDHRRTNAWHAAKERNGDTGGYLEDLTRADACAAQMSVRSLSEGEPAISVGLETRYLLMRASIRSLARTIPAGLLQVLCERSVWTTQRALAYARSGSTAELRAEALAVLISSLEGDEKVAVALEAVHEAAAIQGATSLTSWGEGEEPPAVAALAALARHLPEPALQEALRVAEQMHDPLHRVSATRALIPLLACAGQIDEAVRELERFERSSQVSLLRDLGPLVDSPALAAILVRIEGWPAAYAQLATFLAADVGVVHALNLVNALMSAAEATGVKAPAQATSEWQCRELVSAAGQIEDSTDRAMVLALLGRRCDQALRASIASRVLEQISEADLEYWDPALILREVAKLVPLADAASVLEMAKRVPRFDHRVEIVAELARRFPDAFGPEVREIARDALESDWSMDVVIGAGVTALDPEAVLAYLQSHRDRELAGKIAFDLPTDLLGEAVQTLQVIHDGQGQERALERVSREKEILSIGSLQEALAASGEDRDALILRHKDELASLRVEEAMTVILSIKQPDIVREALGTVASRMSAEDVSTMLRAAEYRLPIVAGLAPFLRDDDLENVLDAMLRQPVEPRGTGLALLFPLLGPEQFGRALEAALAIGRPASRPRRQLFRRASEEREAPSVNEEVSRARALASAVEVLSARGEFDQALDLTEDIAHFGYLPTTDSVTQALSALARNAPLTRLGDVRRVADVLEPGTGQVDVLCAIAGRLDGTDRERLLAEAVDLAVPERWTTGTGRQMGGAPPVYEGLAHAVEMAAQKQQSTFLRRALEIVSESARGEALVHLAPVLAEPLLDTAIEAAQALPELSDRVDALLAFVARLDGERRGEVLREAVRSAARIDDDFQRLHRLEDIARILGQFSPAAAHPFWRTMLDPLARRSRESILWDVQAVAPLVGTLGGVQSLEDSRAGIEQVAEWWP